MKLKNLLMLIVGTFCSISIVSANFMDVPDEFVYKDAIDYAQSQNIIKGYDDQTYKPFNFINRAELTKIIIAFTYTQKEIDNCIANHISKNSTSVYFKDVNKSDWYAPYICLAKKENIIGGYSDNTFRPNNNITFVETAKIITKAFKLSVTDVANKPWYYGYVKSLESRKAIPETISNFERNVTRGDVAEIIYRIKNNIINKTYPTYEDLGTNFSVYKKWAYTLTSDNTIKGYVFPCHSIQKYEDCAQNYDGIYNGVTKDLLSTLIMEYLNNSNFLGEIKLLKFTPKYLLTLDKKISAKTKKLFFVSYMNHLSDGLDILAGVLTDKELTKGVEPNTLIIVNNDNIFVYDKTEYDLQLTDHTVTGGDVEYCSSSFVDGKILWECVEGGSCGGAQCVEGPLGVQLMQYHFDINEQKEPEKIPQYVPFEG